MQAARRASLNPSDPDTPEHTPVPPKRARTWVLFLVIGLAAYVGDVVSKIVAVDRLSGQPDVEVLGSFLTLHLTRNPGAAFSTGTEFTAVISGIAIVALVVVLYLSTRLRSTGWAVAFGFLVAGIAGNLTDRLVREPGPLHGHVIDFLRLPNWPVFNLADIFINVAAGLIIIQTFRGIHLDGTRDETSKAAL